MTELVLTSLEKQQLTSYYKKEGLPYFMEEEPTPLEESENTWLGIQLDKRMFDLCIFWADYQIVCVVYECDLTEDDNWTTNTNAEWYLTDGRQAND